MTSKQVFLYKRGMNIELVALKKAVGIAGGQKALATMIGVTQSHVWGWLNTGRQRCSGEYVLAIEAATGVSKHDLRPDIFGPSPDRPSPPRHAQPSMGQEAAA
ncbi:MAG: YdaS family helix-turn-helix protein [Candidatus Competibacter sp.]